MFQFTVGSNGLLLVEMSKWGLSMRLTTGVLGNHAVLEIFSSWVTYIAFGRSILFPTLGEMPRITNELVIVD